MMIFALHFLLGYTYGLFAEWFIHKEILHRYGKGKNAIFKFHWSSHHSDARRFEFIDPSYNESLLAWNAATKELLSLLFLVAIHTPVLFFAPGAYAALIFSVIEYYFKHRKAHKNPEWAKEKLVWHFDHHMGKIQDMNWGVRRDIVDRLLGTRVKYTTKNNY
jgi:sterol desaturase/sphingolipid hydroxylase (fatty acid hydroxylase superfamily)